MARILPCLLLGLACITTIAQGECIEDGTRYKNSTIWKKDACNICSCNNNIIICHKVTCENPVCDATKGESLFIPPNACCPECTTEKGRQCKDGDQLIAHNTEWSGTNCTECQCSNGAISCHPLTCDDDLQCGYGESPWLRPGECCKKCVSNGATCIYNGKTYRDGDVWSPSKCERAKCVNGEINFQLAQCKPVICPPGERAELLPDQCCPQCMAHSCVVEGHHYESGEHFKKDACHHCACIKGEVTCHQTNCNVTDEIDGPRCAPGKRQVTRDGHCCPECVSDEAPCDYEGIRRYHGDLWNMSNCQACTCTRGRVQCFPLQCSAIECGRNEKRVRKPGSCCPECVSLMSQCYHNGLPYRNGDEWQISACERCACIHGVTQCFKADCAPCPENTAPVSIPGECCPTCELVTCHPDCATCHGPGYGQCNTCKNPRHLLQEGKCVRRCLSGFFQDGHSCRRCDSSCKTCELAASPSTCTSCSPPLQLQDGSCVENCIPGYYDYDGLCKRCLNGCKRCLSATVCVECTNKTMLVQEGECVQSCDKRYYVADDICKPCHPSCATCSIAHDVCDLCPSGRMKQEDLCVSECSKGFYQLDAGRCAACHASCSSCSGPSYKECISCDEGKNLQDGRCVGQCSVGYYANEGRCQGCHPSCRSCVGSSASECSLCSETSQVIQPSSDMSPTGRCVYQCKAGYFSEGKFCQSCHDSCLSCDGLTNSNCTSCGDDRFMLVTSQSKRMCLTEDECGVLSLSVDNDMKQCLNKADLAECNNLGRSLVMTLRTSDDLDVSKCAETCPKGTFKEDSSQGSLCLPCMSGCASCKTKDSCLECADDKVLSILTSQCVTPCEDGYYPLRSGQCQTCPSACASCEVPPHGGRPLCTSCKNPKAVLQFGECVAACAEQFYADVEGGQLGTPVCRECDWTCNRCNGPGPEQCLECMPGSKLQNGRCVKLCAQGFYDDSSICLPCASHCVECTGAKACQRCKLPYHLHERQCVASCPRRYVADRITNECVRCPDHCLHCSSPGTCDQCDGQTFMLAGDSLNEGKGGRRSQQTCIRKCKKGYFGNELTRQCQKNKEKPVIAVLHPIMITMGGRSPIDDTIMQIADADSSREQLSIILELEPANGRIVVDNVPVRIGERIPATKLSQGRLWFVHDANLWKPGLAVFRATDGHLMSAKSNLDIVVVSTSPPKVVKNKVLIVSSGESKVISSETVLDITDKDNAEHVTMTLLSEPKYGHLTGAKLDMSEFTLNDLHLGNIAYVCNKNLNSRTNLDDVINFQVSDGYYIINVAVRVQIVPKLAAAPSLVTNQGARVRAGGLLHITSELLQTVADNVKDKSKLVYILKPVQYTSGEVVRITPMASDDPMVVSGNWVKMEEDLYRSPPLMRFTQEDIDEGDVWYRDLGGHGDVEAFDFEVVDERYRPPRHVTDDLFRVSIIPDNTEEPRVARGLTFPPQMTATEDRITVIHSGYMRYTDEDTPDRDLIYNITKSIPSYFGTIEHVDIPNVPITVFTQSEVDSNKIIFRPPASEVSSFEIADEVIMDDDYDDMLDEELVDEFEEFGYPYKFEALTESTREMPKAVQFEYTVSDGQHTLEPSVFTIKLLNQGNTEGPQFTNPHPRIDVTQGGTAPLGESQLSVSDPDTHHRDLIYTLVNRPRHGSVIRNDHGMRIILREGDSFTHDEIQMNALQYVHDGTSDTLEDQIQVSVTDTTHTATRVIQILILQTDSTGPSPDISTELSLTVDEGSVATLSRDNLAYVDLDSTDKEILYHVESELQHGILDSEVLGDVMPGDTFTQDDINVGYIKYRSRGDIGPSPLTDALQFSVTDKAGNKLANQLLTITITPGGNEPPVVSVGTGIVVDEGGSVLITPLDVIATDSDTPKHELTITITRKPVYGYFLNTLRDDVMNADEDEVWFSMQDVLDGAIYYVQSLHKHTEPTSDFFKFQVSDGHNISPTYSMNVTILPTNDEAPEVETKTLICKNGHATMVLNASLLVNDEDSSSQDLTFTVTSLPSHGSLVRFSEKMPHDMMTKWKMMGNGSLQLDMMEKKKLMKLRVGSTFSYQDIIDELICFESEGYTSPSATLRRRRRDTLGFILSDGNHETPGSINIDVEPSDEAPSEEFDEFDAEEDEDLDILEGEIEEEVMFGIPEIEVNTGITVEKGSITVISASNLLATDKGSLDSSPRYVVVREPAVGFLQLAKNQFVVNISSSGESVFLQEDIDEGIIRYIHPESQPGGNYNFRFNVVGASGSTLPEQTFNIIVKDDKKPPVIRINDGIAVEESSSQVITSEKLSATDEVPPEQLLYTITKRPTLGQIELVRRPGHRIKTFTQDDVNKRRIRYTHTSEKEDQLSDQFTFSLSDGTNSILQSFFITVIPIDNSLPVLENKGIRVQEGVRKTITEFELRAVDRDTSDDLVTFTILQSPQYGSIQKTNHRGRYNPVTGFSMDDIYQSRISYNHDGSNSVEDSFVFKVGDGTNKEFIITEEGEQITTSSQQIFHINILAVDDGTPRLTVNHGLQHLEYNDDKAMGRITNNNLLTEDPDTSADLITYTITSEPRHGHIESNLNPGHPIKSFTQDDVSMKIIRYVLSDTAMNETRDSFMFNVRDSMPNVVTGNIFHIRWSVFSFDKRSYTVKEGAGHIDVLIRRRGNLNYAIVMCRTEAGTATSTRSDEPGLLDYRQYAGQVQFDEHEDEKVCSIDIVDDTVYEGEESFTVELSLPNYALLGAITETIVTIDDTEDKPTVQFDEAEYTVQENGDAVFLPLKRTGDIDRTVSVICYTESITATGSSRNGRLRSGSDYKSRGKTDGQSVVIFAPGVKTATCDVKLIDDSIYEEDEEFVVKLSDPSNGAQVGEKAEATVTISGPNDAPSVFFSDHHYEFSESIGTADVTVVRTGSDLTQSTDVWCSTRAKDPISAVPGEDFVQSSNKVTFREGETTKICTMTLLDDSQAPTVEGNETFEVYLSSVLRAKLVTPNKAVVTINDILDDVPTMEFLKTAVEVKEKDKVVSLPIAREGDTSSTSSAICYTRQATASVEDDFNERSKTETSRIVFRPGQKLAYCNVTIVDDSAYEPKERFSVHLSNAIGSKWYGATVGEKNVVEITITNDEDAPTIVFERSEFSIREPDPGEASREFVVKVIRTGDTTEISKVRCSTRDGSATSGSDYEPKSRVLRFQPGETEVIFTVNILPNDDTELHETFLLVLGPDDPVNAVLGPISQATVTILDQDAAGSLVLPTTPVVVSLLSYDDVKAGLEVDPSPGYPLVCVTPCDPRYPEYADTRNLCEEAGINATAIRFSWEVAMPTSFQEGGGSHPFERVRDTTPFTSVDTKVLDSIYFSRRFHVRCVAQAVDSATGSGGTPLRSKVVTIGTDTGLCHNPIVSGTERGFQAQSFISKLDYIPETAEEHPNTLQISVEIPHQDGRLPLISTMPFNNLKLLLSRSIDRQQHLCSNMMYSGKTIKINPEDLVPEGKEEEELGDYLGFIEPTDYSKLSLGPGFDKPFQLDPTVRERKTIDLYKYLNLKSCVWKFKAHYKMDQLIDYCNGKVDKDYQIRDSLKSLVTVTVPLHVSYVYVTAPTGWGSLEHRTEMQFSFVYDNVLWTPGIQTEGVLSAAMKVRKIRLRDDGRLEVTIETKVKFRGLFVLQHHTLPDRQSIFLAPEGLNIKFDLENIWTENTYDATRQQWRAVSRYSKKDYSGDYELQLLPCTVTPTAKWQSTRPGQEPSCTAFSPNKFKVPITFQQTNRPVPVEYTLNTAFHLCNNEKLFMMDPRKAKEGEQLDYRGSFSRGQTIFGRVFWNPKQDLNSAYKLQLEKLYLCTGLDGYIPTYDPEGIGIAGKQYGCIEPSRNLQHRFLLLDRSNRDSEERYFHDVPFEAYFAGDKEDYAKMADMPGVDGFLIKVDALYKVEAGHQWYLQVLYSIGPESMRAKRSIVYALRRHRRSVGDEAESTGLKNGTNMHPILVSEDPGPTVGVIAGATAAAIIPMLLCCFFAVCLLRRRRRKRKEEYLPKNTDVIKTCSYDDDIASDETAPLSEAKQHKRSNSAGLATVVALGGKSAGRHDKNYNKRRDVSANDVELQPLNSGGRNSQSAARGRSGRKKIPIVNNLRRNNNDDDGTEV